ncbi:putative transesterase [Mycena sanguinolenta]|uniref:Putative transesterase n=1 Tax=Mycena sanguinolenta TaxID=230812 RepID=A0A8H6YB63_9AGAR|nr:putative transesterase [Mycena sanguinolenta]
MSASLRRRLADLDAQIVEQRRVMDEQQRMLEELERTRSKVKRELRATATFPILTLPAEITTEIFLCCLPLFHPLRIPDRVFSGYSTPLVLVSVCRLWRNIALTTPALWSKLDVVFHEISTSVASEPGLVESFMALWLSRACNYPLSLHFTWDDQRFAPNRVRDMIHRWSPRARSLSLDVVYERADICALGIDSAAFPLLQSATVECWIDSRPTPVLLFGNAPCLHDLRVLWEESILAKFAFPWLQLTKFEGTLTDLELFKLTPNLTELTCTFTPHGDDFTVITHHNLTSLTLTGNTCDVIGHLTLPALKCLDVDKMDSNETLAPFLARSSPHLVSLSVRMHDMDFNSGYYLRDFMPLVASTLENLQVSGVSADEIHFILQRLDSSNIKSLMFEDVEGPFDLGPVANFLHTHSTQLRTFRVVLSSCPSLSERLENFYDTIDWYFCRQLSKTGMDIHIGFPHLNYAVRMNRHQFIVNTNRIAPLIPMPWDLRLWARTQQSTPARWATLAGTRYTFRCRLCQGSFCTLCCATMGLPKRSAVDAIARKACGALGGLMGVLFRVGTEPGARVGYGLGGLLTLEDTPGWYGAGTLTGGGGQTFAWFVDRSDGLCGVATVQANIPINIETISALPRHLPARHLP